MDIIHHLKTSIPNLEPSMIDDVIVGCANPEGQGLQVGRLIASRSLWIRCSRNDHQSLLCLGLEAIAIACKK